MVGLSIRGFPSMVGPIMFNPDVFIEFGGPVPAAASGAAATRPGTPTEDVAPAAAGGGPPNFSAGDAGNYFWSVIAINRFGKSAELALTGAVAVAAGDTVTARTADPTVITDDNTFLPGTSTAFLIQQNVEYFSFKQLAPFVKIPLATIDTSIRWMQLLYGAPTVYAPGKSVLYRNVGRAAGSVGGGGAS